MRLRQIALVARELDPVVDDLCAVLGIVVAFRDPEVGVFGLRNAVMPVGDTFLEVVSPITPDASAVRYLARRGGDGGYMVLLQTSELDGRLLPFEGAGGIVVWKIELPDIKSVHLHPRDTGGPLLSLDQPEPPESWRWAGPDWKRLVRSDVTRGIVGAEIQSENPEKLAARWGAILGISPCGSEIRLEGAVLRFVAASDGRGEGLGGIDVAVADRSRLLAAAKARGVARSEDTVVIGGVRIRLV